MISPAGCGHHNGLVVGYIHPRSRRGGRSVEIASAISRILSWKSSIDWGRGSGFLRHSGLSLRCLFPAGRGRPRPAVGSSSG